MHQPAALPRQRVSLFFVILMMTALVGRADAQFGLPGEPSAEDLVSVEVTADVERIVPGKTFHLAVVCRIASQWHIYWKNPGDSGMLTDIAVKAPDVFTIGPTRYPRPKQFVTSDGITNGYSRQVVFLVPVTAPQILEPGSESFEVEINFLVCKKKCFLGNNVKRLTLPTVFDRNADPGEPSELIRKHLPRFPQAFAKLKNASASYDGTTLTVSGPAGDADHAAFIPVPMDGVNFDAAQVSIKDGRFTLAVPVDVDPAGSFGKPLKIEGLIAIGKRSGDPSYEFTIPLDESGRMLR